MKENIFKIFSFLALVFIISSCENEKGTELENNDLKSYVDINSAKEIAAKFKKNNITDITSKSINSIVKDIIEVPDDNNKTAFYIINYEYGGFLILSADKRMQPILAFSEENNFNVNTKVFPTGLVSWLYNTKENIKSIRLKDGELTDEMIKKWNNISVIKSKTKVTGKSKTNITSIVPIEEPDCTPYTITKGPYIQTIWGQGCGYNSELETLNCGNLPCGKAYTGCVATAMAQIMKYHQYPSYFSWNSMQNNVGNYPVALLMKNIGINVGMDYKCDSSSANTEDKVANAFKNIYGYQSANYANYNYQTVRNELDLGRPVILKGGRNTGWWIFGQYSDGHAWVCDGYINYIDPCWGSMLHFHMNWGWDGTYNGYYAFDNFNPGDYTFNYKTGMVYNIKP